MSKSTTLKIIDLSLDMKANIEKLRTSFKYRVIMKSKLFCISAPSGWKKLTYKKIDANNNFE